MADKMIKGDNIKDLMEEIQNHVRGEDLIGLKEQCLQLCQTYLSKGWTQLELKDIDVERLTGGMTNQIYRCKANNENDVEEVVIRFYGDKYDWKTSGDQELRFYDGLVATIASMKGLGPKVYGLFNGGQVLKYYKHRLMSETDFYDVGIMSDLAKKLAKFHSIDAPLRKNGVWFEELFFNDLDEFFKIKIDTKMELFVKYDCKHLLNCDLRAEYEWLMKKLLDFESPIVFSHNDFRMANLMLTDNNGLVLSDFDYSVYGRRGYDFGSLFSTFQKVTDNKLEFKDESVVRKFIASYVEECQQIYGKEYSGDERNSVEYLMKETKHYIMIYSFFAMHSGLSGMLEQIGIFSEQHIWIITNNFVENYLAIKTALINENLV